GLDQFEPEAGLARRECEEMRAVACPPAGFGRDQPRVRNPEPRDLLGADLQRLDRAPDRGTGKMSRPLEPRAEPDAFREGIDYPKMPPLGGGDEHPAAVRPQIQGRVKLRIRLRRPDGMMPPRGGGRLRRTRWSVRHGQSDTCCRITSAAFDQTLHDDM